MTYTFGLDPVRRPRRLPPARHLKYGLPGLTHDQLMTTIELYGQQVIPRVRDLLG